MAQPGGGGDDNGDKIKRQRLDGPLHGYLDADTRVKAGKQGHKPMDPNTYGYTLKVQKAMEELEGPGSFNKTSNESIQRAAALKQQRYAKHGPTPEEAKENPQRVEIWEARTGKKWFKVQPSLNDDPGQDETGGILE